MIDEHEELLAGLDEVDWASLRAEDVPGEIRTVCGNDDQARQGALNSLFGNLFHQGSRYPPSPFAVPFLARIAVSGPRPIREEMMWLLTRLAVDWHDEYDIATGINTVAWRAVAAEHAPNTFLPWYDDRIAAETDGQRRQQLVEARAWVAAGHPIDARDEALRSYDAVLAELPGLLALLDDDDPRVRTRAAYLFAWFPEASANTLGPLLALAELEHDPVVAATALVAVGLVGTSAQAENLAPYLDAEDRLVRWAAATGLARIADSGGGTLDAALLDRAIAELAAAASSSAPTPATDYNEGDFHGHIAATLLTLTTRTPDAALAACWHHVPPDRMGRLAQGALRTNFPVPVPSPLPSYTDLNPSQQQLLHALADLQHAWGTWGIGGRLRDRGLPESQEALRAYAGLPPGTCGSRT